MSIIMDLFDRSNRHSKTLTDDEFWELIRTMRGSESADTVIQHLKSREDEYIFAFEDKLCGLVGALNKKTWADELFGSEPFSKEKFLAARYAAVADGMECYSKIIGHRGKLSDAHICEQNGRYEDKAGLMTAAARAWAEKHGKDESEYPHKPQLN